MQFLDRTGVGTLWSMCKTKFALKDHSHNYLPLSGGTLTGDLLFSNSGTTFRQIRGTCGDNDFWRIGGGATRNNAGYMEIATADDGTEPIYVRQYSGTFGTIIRTATLLDDSGNTSFPGTVAAAKFKGALEGNASTASNAATVNGHTVNANVPANAKFTDTNTWRGIQDNLTSSSTSDSLSAKQGKVLKELVDSKVDYSDLSSYAHKSDAVKNISSIINKNFTGYGEQILKITYASNSLGEVKISNASNNSNGFMSISDKQKLDNIADFANNYTLPTASVSTLGGIKTGYNGNLAGYGFPIELDDEGNAYADIEGLFTLNGNLRSICLSNEVAETVYDANGITRKNTNNEVRTTISFPEKSGTLAITSDIPDVSSLCKFNFVNSISDCVNGRINFLFKNSNEYVDLSFLRNLEEGTISLIYSPFVEFQITDKGSVWYYNGRSVASEDTAYISKAKLVLAFFKDTYVYVCTFSYN